MPKPYLNTPKQREIVHHVLRAADTGEFIELHQLKAKLSYGDTITKQALLCSLKYLQEHGFIEKQRKGRQMTYKPTLKAYQKYRRGLEFPAELLGTPEAVSV